MSRGTVTRRRRKDADEETTTTSSRRSSRRDREYPDETEEAQDSGNEANGDGGRHSRSRRSSSREETRRPPRSERVKDSGSRGLDGYRNARKESRSNFNSEDEYGIKGEGEGIVKFLQPGSIDVFREHWIEGRGKGKRNSFYCTGDESCPLCEIGEPFRLKVAFNVYDVDAGENKYWICGPQIGDQISDFDDAENTSPISKEGLYFLVEKKKDRKDFWQWKLTAVFEDERAWPDDVEPLDEEELEEAKDNLFDNSVIPRDKLSTLEEIADEVYNSAR